VTCSNSLGIYVSFLNQNFILYIYLSRQQYSEIRKDSAGFSYNKSSREMQFTINVIYKVDIVLGQARKVANTYRNIKENR
jgi:hypothetical protein